MLVKAVGPVCRANMPSAEAHKGLMHQTPQHVVICGAGIIGTCTAFFLAKEHGIKTTLVEQHKVAGAASGVGPFAIACILELQLTCCRSLQGRLAVSWPGTGVMAGPQRSSCRPALTCIGSWQTILVQRQSVIAQCAALA